MLQEGGFSKYSESSLDIFRFIDGDPQRTGSMMDDGVLPWWTYRALKAAFWRPVTALTHGLDYQLWPRWPVLMHAHSIMWFALLVFIVSWYYRRLMGLTLASGLAAFLWAIDDAHGMPIAFLANRNIMVCMTFGVWALWAHDRWRRDHWRYGAWAGPLLLVTALLAKESGVAVFAYLFSYALFLDRAGWKKGFVSLLPYVGVIVTWRVIWTHLGYGMSGAGMYVDPVTEPIRFAGSVLKHAPILLLGQWGVPQADISYVPGVNMRIVWMGAVIFEAIILWLMIPLLRQDRRACFWALGMIFSVIPACATLAADRMLFFVGLGGMGLLSLFLCEVFGRESRYRPWRGWRYIVPVVGIIFVLIHVVLAPVLLPLRASYSLGLKNFLEAITVRTVLDDSVARQDVIIVNPPVPMAALYLPVHREVQGLLPPRRVRVLASGYPSVEVERWDAYTLKICPAAGFMPLLFDQLFRNERFPFRRGEQVELAGMSAEIVALNEDNRPSEVIFRFAVPLEDASLRWLRFEEGEFITFIPPPVGESVTLHISKKYTMK